MASPAWVKAKTVTTISATSNTPRMICNPGRRVATAFRKPPGEAAARMVTKTAKAQKRTIVTMIGG